MSKQQNITFNSLKPESSLQELIEDNRFKDFVSIIHDFNIQISKASSSQEIYEIITQQLADRLSLSDCVIYKVYDESQTLEQIAAFGPKHGKGEELKNKLTLKFGEGHAGIAAELKKSILVENCKTSSNYVRDFEEAGSEIEVPIMHNGRVFAVLSSENKEIGFYNDYHLKLFEVIASITAGYVYRLAEKEELEKIKKNLETVLKKKTNDLEMVVDSLSDHYSALKHSHEKREVLLQEVHHRVNNNLQVISSMLNLYGKYPTQNDSSTLQEVHKRVQAMALVHQNFYKSFEQNLVNVKSYFNDLLNYLKSFSTQTHFSFQLETNLNYISIDSLVPLGLLVTELISKYFSIASENIINNILIQIDLTKDHKKNSISLNIQDNLTKNICSQIFPKDKSEEESIADVLISALTEQLEGEIVCEFNNHNEITIEFEDL